MEKKTLYILIAVIAVIVVAGVIIGAVAAGNNNGGSGGGSETTTVTYHGNGGTYGDNKDTYQTTSDSIPLITWSRSGYESVGYTVSTDGTGTVYKYGDKAPSGVKDMYVKWEKITLTVTFINLPTGLQVTDGKDVLKSGDVVNPTDGKCTITVQNVTPGTYTFESDVSISYYSYYVDESGTHKYILTFSGTTYSTGGNISTNRSLDHSEVYFELTNYKTMTLTFELVPPS